MAVSAGQLQVDVTADTSRAEGALSSLGSKLGSLGGLAGGVATAGLLGVAAAGVAVVGGLGAAVGAAAGFESTMSGVKAVSGATAEEMKGLSGLALQLGKDTSFSAAEAGKGIDELIKGGLSIADVMGGGAKSALDLAAAGSISVADAAEIASNAVGQFGLKGADLANVADKIAGAANASSLSVTDFKFSLAAVGAVAATAGLSFDDTAVAIAEMGKAGIKGSDSGTSLKAFISGLTPNSKAAASAMRGLGLITAEGGNQFFDASGKMKSMSAIQGLLSEATKDLTQEQKLMKFETIFGSDAIRAASVLSKEGAEGFDTMAASMGKVTAAAVGAEKMNNLKGSFEQLKGSAETAAITLGMALTPALKQLTDVGTKLLNDAMPGIEAFATGASKVISDMIAGFTGEGGGLGAGAGALVWNIAKMLGVDTEGADALLIQVQSFVDGAKDFILDIPNKLGSLPVGVLGGSVGVAVQFAMQALGLGPEGIVTLGDAVTGFTDALPGIIAEVTSSVGALVTGFQTGGLAGGSGATAGIIAKLLGLDADAAAEVTANVSNIVTQVGGALKSLMAIFGGGDKDKGELQLAEILKNNFGEEAVKPVIDFVHKIQDVGTKISDIAKAFTSAGIAGVIAQEFGGEALAGFYTFERSIKNVADSAKAGALEVMALIGGVASGFETFTSNAAAMTALKVAAEAAAIAYGVHTAAMLIANGQAIVLTVTTNALAAAKKALAFATGTAAGQLGILGLVVLSTTEGLAALYNNNEEVNRTLKDLSPTLATSTGELSGMQVAAALVGDAFKVVTGIIDLWNITSSNASKNVARAIDSMVTEVSYTLMQLGNKAEGFGAAIWQGLVAGISAGIGAVGTAARNLAQGAMDQLKAVIEPGSPSKPATEYAQSIVDAFLTVFGDSANDIALAATGMGNKFMGAIGLWVEEAVKYGDALNDWIVYIPDAFKGVARQLADSVRGLSDAETIATFEDHGRNLMDAITRGFGKDAGTLFEDFSWRPQWEQDFIDQIHELAQGDSNRIDDWFGNLRRAVKEGFDPLKGHVLAEDFSWIKDPERFWAPADALSGAGAAGLGLAASIANGIRDGAAGAITAAADLARDTVNAFNETQQAEWERIKATLPVMQNLMAAPTTTGLIVPPPSAQKIQDDRRAALNASNRSSSAAPNVTVLVGLDNFDRSQRAVVDMERGRSTDRAGRLARGFGRI